MSAETDAFLNNLATLPSAVGALFLLATIVLFGVGSGWYTSYLGVTVFGFLVVTAPVPALVVYTRLVTMLTTGTVATSGDGLGLVRLIIYSLFALGTIAFFTILVYERRGRPVIRIPLHRGHSGD